MALSEMEIQRMVEREQDKAQVLLDAEEGLPYWAWAALVGKWTQTPTWLRCRDGQRLPLWGDTFGILGERHHGLHYEKPITIAQWDGEWHRASGGNMRDWILLLAQEKDRESCLRVHRSAYQSVTDELPQELIETRARILRKLERLSAHPKQLPSMSSVPDIALTLDPDPVRMYTQDEMAQMQQKLAQQQAELELLRKQAGRMEVGVGA